MTRRRVLTVCGDHGGAQAILPVLRLLEQDRELQAVHFAYLSSVDLLKKSGIPCAPLPEETRDEDWVDALLRREAADAILTATSHNRWNWEKRFLRGARRIGIPSLSVLDFWSNYSLRFSNEPGALDCLPDRIAVMDERAREEMIAEGFPADRLIVTGQPAFDALAEHRSRFSEQARKRVRDVLGLAVNERLLLFGSQPLREFYGDPSQPNYLGFDEHGVLGSLCDALERVAASAPSPLALLIRPHPREDIESYRLYHSSRWRTLVSRKGDYRDELLASDLVLGMNSMLLVEACLLGCVVLSLQPGLRKPDSLPTNRWGSSTAVYEEEAIFPKLSELLLDESLRAAARERALAFRERIVPDASKKIVESLYSALHE